MSDLRLSARQSDMMDRIARGGVLQIDDLARHYGLTTQSIRRDINLLCELGLARRLHGAVALPVTVENTHVHARAGLNGPAKRRIAAWIAADIPNGSTVFLGIGTTVHYTAEALREHRDLTVVTNNVDVALVLGTVAGIELHLTGGIWRANDRDLSGGETIRYFEKFYATHSVVGAGGLDPVSGVLDFSYGEAQITNAIIENSRTRYLAADTSKWTRPAAVRVSALDRFTHFVTDRVPDSEAIATSIKDSRVDLVICPPTAGHDT